MTHTTASILTLIAENDEVACSAVVRLVESGWPLEPGNRHFLRSIAAQVIDNKAARKAGTLPKGRELLSAKQLAAWRKISVNYTLRLTELANRKGTK
jgi:hypothetical protein